MLAGGRADVHDPVGHADGLLVVLDDDERVADVAQPHERGDELGVVLLVQADGGLVEDVEHAHQAGADLRGQPDALRLAARERGAGAVEGEVVEAHVGEEAEAVADLLVDHAGDGHLALAEHAGQGLDPGQRVADRHGRDVADVPLLDGHARAHRA